MITQYFDINNRLIIQAPGTLAPAGAQTWVYGDNYNLAIYLVAAGVFQPIGANDTLGLMLFQPAPALPETNLAIISAPTIQTDPAGYQYYQINVNLKTTALANLVQSTNKPALCEFHYTFNPADGERFSSSADMAITVNPDPTQGATGAVPVPPGYPSNPNVFEQIANKNQASGYAGLDANSFLNPSEIPTDTTLHVASGKLSVVAGASGNPYVAVITASFAIPAEGANTPTLTLAAAAPDIVANATVLITDGVSFIPGMVVSISGTSLVVTNNGVPGAVSGTMGANAHVYLGSSAGQVDTTRAGLVAALPTTNPTKSFFRGDKSYAPANYPDLTNVPVTFPPGAHGSQHLSNGNDPVPLATLSLAGLCPSPDGTTISITGGKLAAVIPAGTQPYITTTAAGFTLPAIGSANTFALTLTATWADIAPGTILLVIDGAGHVANLFVQSGSGVNWTVYNIGGGSASGTVFNAAAHVYLEASETIPSPHAGTHLVGGADPIALASAAAAGLCPAVDNTTIQVAASKLAAIIATATAPGIVKPDGTTITIAGGTITAAGPIGHGCRVKNSANISLTSGLQVLTWDTNIYDINTDGFHSTSTNPSRIQVPTGLGGYYHIGASIAFTNSNSGTYRSVGLKYNGVVNSYIAAASIPNLANGAYCMVGGAFHLNAGDYVEVEIAQDGTSLNVLSSAVNLSTFFCNKFA